MRNREELEHDDKKRFPGGIRFVSTKSLQLEVLLDIRDLLSKLTTNTTDQLKEQRYKVQVCD